MKCKKCGREREFKVETRTDYAMMGQYLSCSWCGADPVRHVLQMAAPTHPIVNSPVGVTHGTYEDLVNVPIASGDLIVEYEKQTNGPAKQVDGEIWFGPDFHDRASGSAQRMPCAISVRRIRMRRIDYEEAIGLPASRLSDSGAYARGVKAAREAIATARYDAERSHAEWSIRDVVVPEDAGE